MKKVILGAMALGIVSAANAAIVYSNTIQTGSRFNVANADTIVFDDVNVADATMGVNAALKLNSVTVGIRRGQGSLANDVRVWASAMGSNGLVTGTPVLLGTQSLAARTATGFVTELVTVSGLTQTINTQNQFVGFKSILIGVQMSATDNVQGWRITNGPGANADYMNIYNPVAGTSTSNFFSGNPLATFYIELDATPVPEPGSAIAIAAGLGMLVLRRKKA
jgi:hypothetical protein